MRESKSDRSYTSVSSSLIRFGKKKHLSFTFRSGHFSKFLIGPSQLYIKRFAMVKSTRTILRSDLTILLLVFSKSMIGSVIMNFCSALDSTVAEHNIRSRTKKFFYAPVQHKLLMLLFFDEKSSYKNTGPGESSNTNDAFIKPSFWFSVNFHVQH